MVDTKRLLTLVAADPAREVAHRAAPQARYRLGARPVVGLFRRVCQPRATAQTPGAFCCGLRLMALDGTVEDVPDTPANVRAFGRHHSDRGASAFPQVQGVYLSECGTHAVVDAGFWPCHTSERSGGFRLLRSVGAGLLLLWDRGFHSFEMIERTRARGAHVLGRVPAGVTLRPRWLLPDGSYWAYLSPSDRTRRQRGDHLLVRVIVYTLTDPARPGYGETHRLIRIALDDFHPVTPAQHGRLYQRLLRDIAACQLSRRALRTNPSVDMRKMSNFKLKRGAPSPASQYLRAFAATIHVLPPPDLDPRIRDCPSRVDDVGSTAPLTPCPIEAPCVA